MLNIFYLQTKHLQTLENFKHKNSFQLNNRFYICNQNSGEKFLDQKKQILQQAENLFKKYGFKSITMDDVARDLSISKKTLYQYFTDKNDLVDQCVVSQINTMQSCCESAMQLNTNAIERMIELTKMISETIRQVNPSAVFDLKKYFKPSWDKLDKHRKMYILNNIKENLNQGKKEGLYNTDIEAETVGSFYIHLAELLTDPDNFPNNLNFHDVYKELIKYHMRSICNQKGIEILTEKIKEI